MIKHHTISVSPYGEAQVHDNTLQLYPSWFLDDVCNPNSPCLPKSVAQPLKD